MTIQNRNFSFIPISLCLFFLSSNLYGADQIKAQIIRLTNGQTYPLYPQTLEVLPDITSPYSSQDGNEYIVVHTNEDTYAIIPVTLSNQGSDDPRIQNWGILYGNQLHIDGDDFPSLQEKGLHDEELLKNKRRITGKSVDEITKMARPTITSNAGFLGDNEDIVSVLIGDNRLVTRLGLTHPQLARPLHHLYKLMVQESLQGHIRDSWDSIDYILYNQQKIEVNGQGSKGFQSSIFNDEIRGSMQFVLRRALTLEETNLLQTNYPLLSPQQLQEMIDKLTILHSGEMAAYYIMRYGFYEGHTPYRADPIALAWLFGFKTLEEIVATFKNDLYDALTTPFTQENIARK